MTRIVPTYNVEYKVVLPPSVGASSGWMKDVGDKFEWNDPPTIANKVSIPAEGGIVGAPIHGAVKLQIRFTFLPEKLSNGMPDPLSDPVKSLLVVEDVGAQALNPPDPGTADNGFGDTSDDPHVSYGVHRTYQKKLDTEDNLTQFVLERNISASPWGKFTYKRPGIEVPYVSGTNCKYDFKLPDGIASKNVQHVTITANTSQIFDGDKIGLAGSSGCYYYSNAFRDSSYILFTTIATDKSGNIFTRMDYFIVYNQYWVISKKDSGNMSQENASFDIFEMRHAPILKPMFGNYPHDAVDIDFDAPDGKGPDKFSRAQREATVILFNLHGDPRKVGVNVPPMFVTSGAIAIQVGKRAYRPNINIVFAESCSTLAPSVPGGPYSTQLPTAFGIGAGAVDRAYIGFDASSMRNTNVSSIFFDELKLGQTVAYAVAKAQKQYNDDTRGILPAKLIMIGDQNTTLYKTIYNFPRDEKYTKWYRLF